MNKAPTISIPSVNVTTFNATLKTSFNPSWAKKSLVFKPSLNEELPLKKKAKNDVKVKIPIPPNCINAKIMDCPILLKSALVSITASPVTHTLLVAVNKAFVKLIPWVVALGSISKKAPANPKITKLPTNTMAGLKYTS